MKYYHIKEIGLKGNKPSYINAPQLYDKKYNRNYYCSHKIVAKLNPIKTNINICMGGRLK